MTQDGRQRRRRRGTAPAGPPAPSPAVPTAATAPAKKTSAKKAPGKKAPVKKAAKQAAPKRDHGGERGLRDLAGSGPSQVGVSRALRARDVNRPTEQDLAAAEAELHVVHRNWTPQP